MGFLKAKFHYAVQLASRSVAGRRPGRELLGTHQTTKAIEFIYLVDDIIPSVVGNARGEADLENVGHLAEDHHRCLDAPVQLAHPADAAGDR